MTTRFSELAADTLVQFLVKDSLANVFFPACKLWNTGQAATMMREAVSLMGGYGITEDCPGFLGQKWADAQLEATYEGPEAVQRRQLSITMTNELFLAQFRQWIKDMRVIAGRRPGSGACTLASAMELWLFTLDYLQKAKDADGKPLYHSQRHGVVFPLADALCWLLASRQQILDLLELEEKGPGESGGGRRPGRIRQFLQRPLPRPGRPGRRRGRPHLRRTGIRLQPPPGLVQGRHGNLLPGRAAGRHGVHHARHCRLRQGAGDAVEADGATPRKRAPVRPNRCRPSSSCATGSTSASPAHAWPRTGRRWR